MSIENLSDDELDTFIQNYRAAGRTEGGRYSLKELCTEQLRRNGRNYNGSDVVNAILKISRKSERGLVSYGNVWSHFYPDREWIGNNTQREVGNMLAAAIYYCALHKLPIVTCLVVRETEQQATENAKENIFRTARDCGVDTGPDIHAFYQSQLNASLQLAQSSDSLISA